MSIVHQDDTLTVHHGDALTVLATLPDESVHCVVTSPPFWGLRDYGVEGQLGLERTPDEYVANLVAVCREVRRVLRPDGTVWLNLGDAYVSTTLNGDAGGSFQGERRAYVTGPRPRRGPQSGLKPKDRVMIPARVALALQADGWWLRDEIVWSKPNPMPSSVLDRTTPAHEMVYLLTKSARYWFDSAAIAEPSVATPSDRRKMVEGRDRIGGLVVASDDPKMAASGLTNIGRKRSVGGRAAERVPRSMTFARDGAVAGHVLPGQTAAQHRADRTDVIDGLTRNKRSVWTVATAPYPEAHFATFPPKLIEPMILAGCPKGGTVLDPFAGSGTTGLVAGELGRKAILIDLNTDYIRQAIVRASRGLVDPGGHEVPDDSLWAVGS